MRRALLVSVFVALVMTAPAFGGTIAVTLGLGSGGLSVQAPAAAAARGAQTVQIPVTIADARGTGAGWALKLASPTPVTVTSIIAHCSFGSTCTLPKASTAPDGQTLLQVAPGTGMGVMQLDVTIAPLGAGKTSVPVAFSVSR